MRQTLLSFILTIVTHSTVHAQETGAPTDAPGWGEPPTPTSSCGRIMSQAGFVKAESIIAADEFCDMKGIEVQNNPAGGQNIAFIDADDSMSYDVTLYHGDGYYTIVFQIASPDGDGSFQLLNYATGEIYLEMKDFPATGSWDVYESVRASVVLPRGSLTLSLKALSGGWNYNGMKVSPQFTVGSTNTSTTDNSGSFFNPDDPTATTATESSTNEGNDGATTTDSTTTGSSGGSTWWETAGNTPTDGTGEASWTTVANGAFHSVVMIEAGDFEVSGDIVTEPCSEGGENLSYIGNGDRLQFMADIPSTGVYEMSVRVASLAGDGSFLVIDSDSKALLGDLTNMPSTGWWQTWETVVVSSNVEMTRGQHAVTVLIPEGGFNIRWLHFELLQPIRGGSTQSSNSNGRGRAPAAPTVILLQGDDLVDAQGVILEGDNGRTQTMAYLDAGDWLLFDVNPPVSGTYAIEVRLSSPSGDGSFILRDAETLQSYGGLSDLPSTGDWATARSARVADISLQAGRVVPLEVLVNEGGWDLQWISLTLKER